ncbi:MAG: aldo/keto reductase [Oceanipulchritudo sp.]
MSEIGIGAWQLGESSDWTSMSEKEAVELVHKALDQGVNFFDTAPNYGLGTSEERLGKALKEVARDRVVINTKFGHSVTGETNFESSVIRESLEGSLQRLKTDYLDSLIIHNPSFEYLDGNRTDHYEILEKLVEEGKIRAYGASLDTYDEMKLLMDTTGSRVIEAFFNILFQDTARAFDQAKEQEVAIIAKIPLDSGWLSGKYTAETEFEDIRKRWSAEDKRVRAGLVEQVKQLLPDDIPLSQAALSFCLAFDAVSTVIPGNRTLSQLQSNLESAGHPLPAEVVGKLREFYREKVAPLNLPW